MITSVGFWSLIFAIGVFDAREHRIPNSLILALIIYKVLEIFFLDTSVHWSAQLVESVEAMVIFFSIGMAFYILKVLSAGDVKLLGVVGLYLIDIQVGEFIRYLSWALITVGLMYLILNGLGREWISLKKTSTGKSFGLSISTWVYSKVATLRGNKLTKLDVVYMPFSPVLVIGLAMYQYSYL